MIKIETINIVSEAYLPVIVQAVKKPNSDILEIRIGTRNDSPMFRLEEDEKELLKMDFTPPTVAAVTCQ